MIKDYTSTSIFYILLRNKRWTTRAI